MVLLKGKPSSLADRQALLLITLSTSSPTVSLSAPEDPISPFKVLLTISIAASTQPTRPITLCTYDTALATQANVDPAVHLSFDTLALGTFAPLQSSAQPTKTISLGNWHPNIRHSDPPPDMRERDWLGWITVPAQGSVQVAHPLPLSRMFKYESKLDRKDLVPGEEYRVHMDPGHVGPGWWCWGDLDGDLKEKKFSEWRKGWDGYNFGVEEPETEALSRGEWVVGEDPEQLWVEEQDGGTSFQFTE